jgi:hypothetical protein
MRAHGQAQLRVELRERDPSIQLDLAELQLVLASECGQLVGEVRNGYVDLEIAGNLSHPVAISRVVFESERQ